MNQPSNPSDLTIPSDAQLDQADEHYWEAFELLVELQHVLESLKETDASFNRKQAELQVAEHRLRRAADELHQVRSRSPETLALNSAIPGRGISRSKEKAIRLSFRISAPSRPRARSSKGSGTRTRGSRRTSAGSKAPPGDDGGGDPEPSGLELATGGHTDKSTQGGSR